MAKEDVAALLIDVRMPEQEEGTEAVVGRWLKSAGEPVSEYEPLLEINTDKVVVEVAAPCSGRLSEIVANEGDAVEPGQVLGRIQASDSAVQTTDSEERVPPAVSQPERPVTSRPAARSRLSPAVRKVLKERQVDLSQIAGSGRGGRITYQDVLAHLERAPETTSGSRRIAHSPMRKAIASHMVESMLRTAPHVTAVFEADFSQVIRDRMKLKEEFKARGANLTYTSYLVAATAQALAAVPEVNSRWHDDALELLPDCNIGVAMALGKEGLVVPVLEKAQDLDLFTIASRLDRLRELAQRGRLERQHLQGGTFTLTNHGTSGSLIATPIINQPQSAILGVGKVQKRLIVDETEEGDNLRIRPMAYVTLTIDHRALDGFTANLFLSHFVRVLEEW